MPGHQTSEPRRPHGAHAGLHCSLNGGAWNNVGTALSTSLTGLSNGTAYTVQVEAVNGGGTSSASSSSFTTLPSTPGTPTFSAVTATSATVSWTAAAGVVSSYQYSVNAGAWTNVGASLSASLTGLSPVTTYTVQVQAVNGTGVGTASSGSFTTLPVTETATVTSELYNLGPGAGNDWGFYIGQQGSISPTTLNNGTLTYHQFVDYHGTTAQGSVAFSGFTSNPGAGWLVSATAGSTTQLGSNATFTYTAGEAIWSWSTIFGLPSSGTVAVQVVHH